MKPTTRREAIARAAGFVVAGFDGTRMTRDLRDLLGRGIAGTILFKRNVVDPWQVAALLRDIRRTAGRPLFLSVDQEGGPVQRLRVPFTEFPAHGVLGRIGDPALTRKVASVIAAELRAIGFNVDFAPLADVDTNPANPVIGIRAFAGDPTTVACHAVAWIRGMQRAGVMACAKHFPGHGDTSLDSHHALPRLAHGRSRIESVELVPFRKAIAAKVGSIMTAHVVFEALDPGVPATLSRAALTDLLRGELGFEGLVVSDDLEMRAVADGYGVGEAAVRSLAAGADLLLVCKTRERVIEAIDAVADGLLAGRLPGIDASERRIAAARRRFLAGRPLPSPTAARRIVGRDAHKRLAEEVARRAAAAGIAWAPPSAVAVSPVSTT